MAKFEAQFRSKTKEVPPTMIVREFGGMEPGNPSSYRLTSENLRAKNESGALSLARAYAKNHNLVFLKLIKTVWEKRNAVA